MHDNALIFIEGASAFGAMYNMSLLITFCLFYNNHTFEPCACVSVWVCVCSCVQFYSILFYCLILFCSILFYSFVFHSILLCAAVYSVLFFLTLGEDTDHKYTRR